MNAGAIPVAVLTILFGALTVIFRERIWDAADRRAGRTSSPERRRFVNAYAFVLAIWCFALAAIALFHDFD